MSVNILHINQSDILGGAAIAAYRLHEGLLSQAVNSRILAGTVASKSDQVAATPQRKFVDKLIGRVTHQFGLNYINHLGTWDIFKHNFYKEADVLHFHNLHKENYSGYFNYLALPSLTNQKPAILTLHDMWSFTGHCAYSYDCNRWKQGCGKCPYLNLYPPIPRDGTKLEWQLKDWVYHHSNLIVVAPSHWLTEQARQSILSKFPIYRIPYGLNTEAYQPLDSQKCKSLLNIPENRNVLMFAATSLRDQRKGGDLLLKALQNLPQSLKDQTVLLTVGYGGDEIIKSAQMQTISLGFIDNDRLKSMAYSAADLFVFPTRADNLPLTVQESLACGTPIVSFNIGGLPDLVRPGITGYLAEPEKVEDLTQGIVQLLKDKDLLNTMSQSCRAIALEEYSLELQAKSYIELYQQILANKDSSNFKYTKLENLES